MTEKKWQLILIEILDSSAAFKSKRNKDLILRGGIH